ncbi:putative response regulatory protein YgeK [Phycisphaerales bacterium]|nr:putative response regulatory protein YgeK [Phycisphaerales bacterium]
METRTQNSSKFDHGNHVNGDTAWASLTQDAGAFVFALDSKGEFVYANRSGIGLLHDLAPDPVGRTLSALFGREFGDERLALMERARTTGQPARIMGMMNGVLLSEAYRSLRPQNGVEVCLLTAHPAGLEGDFTDFHANGDRYPARTNHLGKLAVLTERELELLHHIGMGRTSEETAHLMHRSTRTVEWHRASLGQKLNCDNRVQLARVAVRAGLNAVDLPFITALHRSAVRPRP